MNRGYAIIFFGLSASLATFLYERNIFHRWHFLSGPADFIEINKLYVPSANFVIIAIPSVVFISSALLLSVIWIIKNWGATKSGHQSDSIRPLEICVLVILTIHLIRMGMIMVVAARISLW